MPEPTAALQAVRASTADLQKALLAVQWSDAELAHPSLCEGWTRGHVLTHLARNADGITGTLSGALRGDIVPRYPGGMDARNKAIEEGASRHFAAQVADLRDSAARLDRVFGAVSEADGWDLPTDEGQVADQWVFARLREVEIHRVDLDAEYSPDRWPPLMVSLLLPQLVEALGSRLEQPVRIEITSQRTVVPDLAGRTWDVGAGSSADAGSGAGGRSDGPDVVRGPDWAVLAWLVGRGAVVAGVLGSTPALAPWR